MQFAMVCKPYTVRHRSDRLDSMSAAGAGFGLPDHVAHVARTMRKLAIVSVTYIYTYNRSFARLYVPIAFGDPPTASSD